MQQKKEKKKQYYKAINSVHVLKMNTNPHTAIPITRRGISHSTTFIPKNS